MRCSSVPVLRSTTPLSVLSPHSVQPQMETQSASPDLVCSQPLPIADIEKILRNNCFIKELPSKMQTTTYQKKQIKKSFNNKDETLFAQIMIYNEFFTKFNYYTSELDYIRESIKNNSIIMPLIILQINIGTYLIEEFIQEKSPLMLACEKNNPILVSMLLADEERTDIFQKLKENKQQTAFTIAAENHHHEILHMLLKKASDSGKLSQAKDLLKNIMTNLEIETLLTDKYKIEKTDYYKDACELLKEKLGKFLFIFEKNPSYDSFDELIESIRKEINKIDKEADLDVGSDSISMESSELTNADAGIMDITIDDVSSNDDTNTNKIQPSESIVQQPLIQIMSTPFEESFIRGCRLEPPIILSPVTTSDYLC